MASLELMLLGPFEARGPSGAPIVLPTRKAEAILAYACLAPGKPHPRDRLVNLLWSERGEDQARNSLRHALSAIRKALPDGDRAPLVVERTAVEVRGSGTAAWRWTRWGVSSTAIAMPPTRIVPSPRRSA